MIPLLQNQPLPELMPVGSIENLGSTVLEGNPEASIAMLHGAPTDALTCGIFSCTKGRFEMVYPFTEHATVLEGQVELINKSTGDTQVFSAGDSWFVEQGTNVEWNIQSDRFVKHYLGSAS